MPNNLSKNTSQIILQEFLKKFEANRVLSKTVNRELIRGKHTPKTGAIIQLKRPHQFGVIRTPGGDITGKTKNNLISATATAKVDDYITVAVEWSQLEEAIELNQLPQILSPIAERMATELETTLALKMLQNGALSIGTPGNPLSQWDDVATVEALMDDLGIKGTNYAVISPWAMKSLAGTQIALTNNSLVQTAWEKAVIPRNFAGVTALSSNGLVTRTQGAFGGALTVAVTPITDYTTTKDTYQFTVTLAGATPDIAGFLKAGDQLVFKDIPWVNQQTKQAMVDSDAVDFTATVMIDAASDAAGNVSVLLSGAPIWDTTNPQYNTVAAQVVAGTLVEVRGVASKLIKPNLFYNEQFFGIGSVVLPKLHSVDSSVISFDGLSIRVHKYSGPEANTQMARFDILPTFCCFNPMMGGQLFGQM